MTTYSKYIDVAVALPVDKTFIYAVPEPLIPFTVTGKRVLVPFGRRRVTGYILGKAENTSKYSIKCILDILDKIPLFDPEMIPFFTWVSKYYMYPVGQVIKNALPGGLTISDFLTITLTEKGKNVFFKQNLNPLEKEILSFLHEKGKCRIKTLCKQTGRDISGALIQSLQSQGFIDCIKELHGTRTQAKTQRYVSLAGPVKFFNKLSKPRQAIIKTLQSHNEISVKNLKQYVPTAANLIKSMSEQGYISIFNKNVYRDPFGDAITPDVPPELTSEQSKVILKVQASIKKGFAAYLLAGVTGSGKTEVYMQVAAKVIKQKRTVLVLVPEIALIAQIERRFRARFGQQVAVLHSSLSKGERYDQWMRILNNEVYIVVGARSAIFAPLKNIGMIIVDEEHDTSYKQGTDLLYNARDIAVVRAKLSNAVVILGSATPSVQSYYNVRSGKFTELTLTKRVQKRLLPHIKIIDLRQNKDTRGARRFITPELHQAIRETLDNGEQILLFLNRRGFASFPVCAACGEPVQCEHCDITMTMHKLTNVYKCHYCGFIKSGKYNCKACGSSQIKLLGMGTEKVETAIKALFPKAAIARLDRDTTTRKGSILKVLKGLKSRAIDILIGTQMIAKGHDFPNITLVGIICADLSLSFPDFRAAERTFQLLAQVAGRAGRGKSSGRVLLQTYAPEHFSIIAAQHQDFRAFYNTEIGFRKALDYPPFSRIIQLKISGKDKNKTQQTAQTLGDCCQNVHKQDKIFLRYIQILGPVEASVSKIADHFRWQILIKGTRVKYLHKFTFQIVSKNSDIFNNPKIKIIIDVDPFFMS